MIIRACFRRLMSLLTLTGIMATSPAYASTSASGYPVFIDAMNNGIFLFTVTSHPDPWVSCATTHRYGINVNTMAGQALYSTILTSMATKTPLMIFGSGTCNNWADSEDVGYIHLGQ